MNKSTTSSKTKNKIKCSAESPTRLDRYLKRHFKYLPQAIIEKSLRKRLILVNGEKAESKSRVGRDDEIAFPENFYEFKEKKPKETDARLFDEFKKWVIFEDKKICVINKPYNMPTQGGEKVRFSVDMMANSGAEKHYLVHRLDRYTTGLLVLAKTPDMANFLMHKLRDRNAKKYYMAVVSKKPVQNSGVIDAPINKKLIGGEEKMVIDRESGKNAKTRYRVVKKLDDGNYLLCIKLYTGRKHQIRVHLASIGMPILGDIKYGGASSKRMMLHAYKFEIPNYFSFSCKN